MNNGDYFSDPDYDDFEFREQHPYVYGDDDDNDDYNDRPCPNSRYAPSRPTTESDVQFHYKYLAWKARNKERIEQLSQPSGRKSRPQTNQNGDIEQLIIVICILIFVVFMCICFIDCG